MQLPSRLRTTTLGDVLGALHGERATGTLELLEDRGRLHRVHLLRGLVSAVELDGAGPSLADILRDERAASDDVLRRSLLLAMASHRLHGEVLVHDFHLSPAVVGRALRRQVIARLAAIERVDDARIRFRVALRPPRWALTGAPLSPSEVLYARGGRPASEPAPSSGPTPSAWLVLGVSPGSDVTEIKRAYRRLVRTVHPDLHPGATEDERRELEATFVRINDAYRALVA